MKVFTFEAGVITPGAKVTKFRLSGGQEIPAIILGEEGRGRKRLVVPVSCTGKSFASFQAGEDLRILYATLGQTQSGNPKLLESVESDSGDKFIGIFPTHIGYRGSNSHTGDRTPDWGEDNKTFLPFPGEEIAYGVIAQGTAGAMGSGKQIIAICPYGQMMRTGIGGRTYGDPTAYYYKVSPSGDTFVCTGEERGLF